MPRMTLSGSHTAVPAATSPARAVTRERYDAVLFDLDGVLTSTAAIHAASWKRMFDDYLRGLSLPGGDTREPRYRPFDIDTDYKRYVDGKPRYEGVKSFLQSRA